MQNVLSRMILGMFLASASIAQAGLFDAVTGGIGNIGSQLVKGAMDSGSDSGSKDSGSSDSAAQPVGVTIKLENMDASLSLCIL